MHICACDDASSVDGYILDSMVGDVEVDAVQSWAPSAKTEDVPPLAAPRSDAVAVRVRVWNTRTRKGDRTEVSLADAQAALMFMQMALLQCDPFGYQIDLQLESVGVVEVPEQCFKYDTRPCVGPTGGPSCYTANLDCARFLFGALVGPIGAPGFGHIGAIGRRIDGYQAEPELLGEPPLTEEEHGRLDLVFVHSFNSPPGAELMGLAGGNRSRMALLTWEELLKDPQGYLRVIGHEMGHCAGGYPNGLPDSQGGHVDPLSMQCTLQPPEERHLMCGWGNGGVALGEKTCNRWYTVIKSSLYGPRNYNELCDQRDNDLDGAVDEDPACL